MKKDSVKKDSVKKDSVEEDSVKNNSGLCESRMEIDRSKLKQKRGGKRNENRKDNKNNARMAACRLHGIR